MISCFSAGTSTLVIPTVQIALTSGYSLDCYCQFITKNLNLVLPQLLPEPRNLVFAYKPGGYQDGHIPASGKYPCR
ncbi:hypothetical protein BDV18DRAFT_132934 [Aspergillus unguis]